MCRFWNDPVDLGSQVSRSLIKLIKSNPMPGWVKADNLLSDDATQELLELREKVLLLENEVKASKTEAPAGSDNLKQGDDVFELSYEYEKYDEGKWKWERKSGVIELTWNSLFFLISPLMVDEADESTLKNSINSHIYENIKDTELKGLERGKFRKPTITDNDFQTAKIQFRALGLLEKNEKKRSIKDTGTYWSLTPYGDTIMVNLRALKR